MAELVRVHRALSVVGDVDLVGCEGSLSVDFAVHVDAIWLGHIWLGAVDPLALVSACCVVLIEALEPESACVGSKRPLTDPDLIFVLLEDSHLVLVLLADRLNCVIVRVPGWVVVVVDDNVVVIIIGKEVIPGHGIKLE